MALRKVIETSGKVTVQTDIALIDNGIQNISFLAYIKVMSIEGNKSSLFANVNFKGDTQQFNKSYQIPVSVENGSANFIAQVYAYLKTLPEFSGAIDC
jgi:hypothetical protein